MAPTVALLSPGAMGAVVGQVLREHGATDGNRQREQCLAVEPDVLTHEPDAYPEVRQNTGCKTNLRQQVRQPLAVLGDEISGVEMPVFITLPSVYVGAVDNERKVRTHGVKSRHRALIGRRRRSSRSDRAGFAATGRIDQNGAQRSIFGAFLVAR